MSNIILGKESLLTNNLQKKLKNAKVFPTRTIQDITSIVDYINKSKHKNNLILNNFYPSKKIQFIKNSDYIKFYEQSILYNAEIFSKINPKKIKKILYSSSSAVYNSIRKDYQNIDLNNKSLYSSTKIAAENLVYNFCSKNKLPFIILRIFNMYSNKGDDFSIVSKISKILINKKEIKIFNKGQNIRDYIHVNDVVKLYIFFIKKKNLNNFVYDIGTGKGIKLIDLINFIGKNKFKLKYVNKNIDEVEKSIASNNLLNSFIFKKIENNFFKKKKIKQNLISYDPEGKNLLQDIVEGKIIYGTGNAATQVFKALRNQNQIVYCFVDDDKNKHNKTIFGKRIISSKELENLAKIKIINSLIIAIPSLKQSKLNFIKKKFQPYINEISFVPLKETFKSEIISLSDLINLQTDAILGKKKRTINFNNFDKPFKNKVILVTGGAGSIGSQLVRQLLKTSCKKIIAYDNSEIDLFNLKNEFKGVKKINLVIGDILDKKYLSYIIKNEKINLIFHAAAYKHLVMLENNVQSAIRNNIFGTKNVVEVAKENKVSIITISTDKAVQPQNILGFTKRISEVISLVYNSKNFSSKVVRFGNVFGSVGSAIPTFINQINNKLPITITHKKVKRYFMTLNDACFLLMTSVNIKNPNNVMVLKMGKPIKILNIINSLIKFKKKFDPNYKYEILEIGLQKGEKLNEKLSISGKLIKTKNKDINVVTDPQYGEIEINNLLKELKLNFNKSYYLKKIMRNFLSKDFKK